VHRDFVGLDQVEEIDGYPDAVLRAPRQRCRGRTFTPVETFFLGKPKVPQYQILSQTESATRWI
jgi:hypothetical protein